ncbi:MAG TPA: hypothetical protein VM093_06005 [Aeromicrobium sp.]|nr:hypothetical protein [Aeromicrobium sp.]
MGFRWVAVGRLKAGDLLYWPAYTSFDGDVMLRDAAEAVADVQRLGDSRVQVMIIDKSASGVVLTLTGEYEEDELVPIVDEATVQIWIDEAVEELIQGY